MNPPDAVAKFDEILADVRARFDRLRPRERPAPSLRSRRVVTAVADIAALAELGRCVH